MDTAPQLPEGKQHLNGNSPPAGSVAENTLEFRKTVDQSKAKLAGENPPPDGKWKPGGRGRKPNWAKKVSGEPAPRVQSETPPPSVAKSAQAAPDVTAYLIAPLAMISKIPAGHYGIPELALTPDEAHLCAMSCNQLLQIFVPEIGQMSPKTAAVVSAFSTFGAIGFSKYQIYLSKIKEKLRVEKPPEPQDAPPITSPFPVFASDHFRKPQ